MKIKHAAKVTNKLYQKRSRIVYRKHWTVFDNLKNSKEMKHKQHLTLLTTETARYACSRKWAETCFVSWRSVGRPSTMKVVVVAVEVGVAAVAVDSTKFISSSGILSVSPSHYTEQKVDIIYWD